MSDAYNFGMAQPAGLQGLLMAPPPTPQAPQTGILGTIAHALGGLLGGAPQAPQQAPGAPQSPYGQVPTVAGSGGLIGDIFPGLKVADYNRKMTDYQNKIAAFQAQETYAAADRIGQKYGPEMRDLYLTDRPGFEKKIEPYTLDKQQARYDGGGALEAYNPLTGLDDKSGRSYSVAQNGGMTASQSSLGGDFTNGPGNSLVSGRTGDLQGIVNPPENFAASNTYVPTQKQGFNPTLSTALTTTGGQPPTAAPQVSAPGTPRGIRNNNPLNVTTLSKGRQWNGQVGTDGDYATFNSPEAGLAAADKNLQAYGQLHGINTVADVVHRWTGGTTPAAYANGVAAALGVKPTDKINLADPAVRQAMLPVMAKFENGRQVSPPAAASAVPPSAPVAVNAPRIGQPTPTPAPAAQGQPAPAASNLPPGSIPGKVAVPLTPAESENLGLGPGRYQREPDGKITTVAPAPQADVDYVKSLKESAGNATDYARLADQFDAEMRSPKAKGTGPIYGLPFVGGAIQKGMGALDPTLETQENLGTQMATALRAPGMRLTQMEFKKFGEVSPSPENFPSQNDELIQNAHTLRDLKQARANFFEKYLYDHNTLNGAAQQWQPIENQKYGQGPAPSPAQNAPRKVTRMRYDAQGNLVSQ